MRGLALLTIICSCCSCTGEDATATPDATRPASECPEGEAVAAGAACDLDASLTCFTSGSVCGLAWGTDGFAPCRCAGGVFQCDDLYPVDGADCPYDVDATAPASCSREGPPSCDPGGQPSGAYCACTNGAWICDDNCFAECPATYRSSLEGRSCAFGATCSYAGGPVCACRNDVIVCDAL